MQNINLLNDLPIMRYRIFTANTLFAGAVFLILLMMGISAFNYYNNATEGARVTVLQQEKESLNNQLSSLNTAISKIQQQINSYQQIDVAKDASDKQKLVGILQQKERKGFARYLTAFAKYTPEGVWLTSFDLSGPDGEVTIMGNAESAVLLPQFIKNLGSSEAFQGKRFATIQLEKVSKVAKVANDLGSYFSFELQTTSKVNDKK
ncbi:MAG: PilN domain-containing protein [Gammaproteobacteria bacterium]|nr:PilN domain-containing protein [Gammaproteobacteria bacterium]